MAKNRRHKKTWQQIVDGGDKVNVIMILKDAEKAIKNKKKKKLDDALVTLAYIKRNFPERLVNEEHAGDKIEKLFDILYFNDFLRCTSKQSFVAPILVHTVQILVNLLVLYRQKSSLGKLKEMRKTQKKNEPMVYAVADDAITRMGGLK